jgi:hypothetical protein
MKNEHIELVKKWLDNPESVSRTELEANAIAADAHYQAAVTASYAAASALPASADANNVDNVAVVAAWVKQYEEINNG